MATSLLRASVRQLVCAWRASHVLAATKRVTYTSMPYYRHSAVCYSSRPAVFAMQADGDNPSAGIAGLKETAALDQLIDLLISAQSDQQMAELVAENIMSCDQKFWLRLATRCDTAATQQEKDALNNLANKAMMLVDRIVRETENQLQSSAQVLQEILKAAADDKGEWTWPLAADRVEAMRAAMEAYSDRVDEALLSNAFAYIRKVSEDGLDGMVKILQKVLQIYAGRQLGRGSEEGAEGVVNQVLRADEDQWVPLIRDAAAGGKVTEVGFMEALQKKMEATVLTLKSGSYAQVVQAEYLKELEGRAKSVFKELSAKA